MSFHPSYNREDTICAIATPSGEGAIALIRLSGSKAFNIAGKVFQAKNKNLTFESLNANTIHYGSIRQENGVLDEVLVSVFRNPNSYTGEDIIEISCHGSGYIQQKIIELLIKQGCRHANKGEFTLRAFLNGKLDLSQAESVADLIASDSSASHELAMKQMRGGYSEKISKLRQELLDFTSLLELELDFSEEDVEFADRKKFMELLEKLEKEVRELISSFQLGNALKRGIPVAIIGKPNVGKSTLLNALLNEEKAIVSAIPGTTRDSIEDTIVIEGIAFRFIDTAGLRDTKEEIEKIGIERTREKINQAHIVLCMFDISKTSLEEIKDLLNDCGENIISKGKKLILIANKTDLLVKVPKTFKDLVEHETIFISAKRKENIRLITDSILKAVDRENIEDKTIVSNIRHYEALQHALDALEKVKQGFETDLPSDLISIDIRDALYHLGLITGEVTTDEILGNIFGRFCIGK